MGQYIDTQNNQKCHNPKYLLKIKNFLFWTLPDTSHTHDYVRKDVCSVLNWSQKTFFQERASGGIGRRAGFRISFSR